MGARSVRDLVDSSSAQDSAVLVAEDWVVSIHGKKLSHNVSAMALLLNSIGQELNAPISVDFRPFRTGTENPCIFH